VELDARVVELVGRPEAAGTRRLSSAGPAGRPLLFDLPFRAEEPEAFPPGRAGLAGLEDALAARFLGAAAVREERGLLGISGA
jgi:hypothetical protein